MHTKNSHCSFCGKAFPQDVKFPHECTNCSNVTYINPVTCVMMLLAIISDDYTKTGVLLVRRNIDPGKGGFALPGGFLDLNESLEEAAARELREETTVEVSPVLLKYEGNALASNGNMLVFFSHQIKEKDLDLSKFAPHREVSELRILWDEEFWDQKVNICFPTHHEVLRLHFLEIGGLL